MLAAKKMLMGGGRMPIEFVLTGRNPLNTFENPDGVPLFGNEDKLEGDLMVVFIGSSANSGWTAPAGWTIAANFTFNGDWAGLVAYKVVEASESGVENLYFFENPLSGASAANGFIAVYRNAAFDVVSLPVYETISSRMVVPGVTAGASGSILLAFFFSPRQSESFSSPTAGLVEINSEGDTSSSSILYADDDVGAGATGDKSVWMSEAEAIGIMAVIGPA